MKFTEQIDIDLPRDRVIALFDSTENLCKWQPELPGFEHQSGEPGQVGAQSQLRYRMGKKECSMIETITVRNLPDEFSGTYETDGMWNEVRNRFVAHGPDTTRWISDNEFRCQGLLRIMAFIMPGMFRKQTCRYMQQFKAFAERTGKPGGAA